MLFIETWQAIYSAHPARRDLNGISQGIVLSGGVEQPAKHIKTKTLRKNNWFGPPLSDAEDYKPNEGEFEGGGSSRKVRVDRY
jgi:hypothetical protein